MDSLILLLSFCVLRCHVTLGCTILDLTQLSSVENIGILCNRHFRREEQLTVTGANYIDKNIRVHYPLDEGDSIARQLKLNRYRAYQL